MKKFLSTGALIAAAAAGLAIGAPAPARATPVTTLLSLTDAPAQRTTPYSLSFMATGQLMTVFIGGYQDPSFEQVTDAAVYRNGTGPNLLHQTWDFVPAVQGSDSEQYSDGTSVNALLLGGITAGDYDTYSQTIATTIGTFYTLDFLFTEDAGGVSGFLVTDADPPAPAPEPVSVVLLGAGLLGLGLVRRKRG